MQGDPTRDCLTWITSYNSIFHRPGVPLFDLLKIGWEGSDERMFFSYYASDKTNDPEFENASPELRANPSMPSWKNQNYLVQQKGRLPSHVYRRLHENLPGSPEGSAYSAEKVFDAIESGIRARLCDPAMKYVAFADMSGGSSEDACLGIAHKAADGRAMLDLLTNQGPRPPFDPNKAVLRFAAILKEWGCFSVTGDAYAGETFRAAFSNEGIGYAVSELSKSEIY